jgi:hypothetical protein
VRVKRKSVALEARLARVMEFLTPRQLMELCAEDGDPHARVELGKELLQTDPARAVEPLRQWATGSEEAVRGAGGVRRVDGGSVGETAEGVATPDEKRYVAEI